jgi:hypothetical protein
MAPDTFLFKQIRDKASPVVINDIVDLCNLLNHYAVSLKHKKKEYDVCLFRQNFNVSYTQVCQWTGDNLTEIQAFIDQLNDCADIYVSVNKDGELLISAFKPKPLLSGFCWRAPPGYFIVILPALEKQLLAVLPESELRANYCRQANYRHFDEKKIQHTELTVEELEKLFNI